MTNRPNNPYQAIFPPEREPASFQTEHTDFNGSSSSSSPLSSPVSETPNSEAAPSDDAPESGASAENGAHTGHHHSHLHAEDLLLMPAGSGRHHSHSTHRHKKRHPVRKALLAILCCLLGIVVIAAGTVLILHETGRSALLNTDQAELSVPAPEIAEVEIHDNGQRVVYNGQTYQFNTDRTNILCMGTDKTNMGLDDNIVGTGGQADTIMLLSIDTGTGAMDVVTISRDTMTDIDIFATDGSFSRIENTQICLAYAYGDGREGSCENLSRSVQRLLYGIPINTYFAMDLSSIAVLNDAIGGVEVTLLEDFKTSGGAFYSAGETLTLHGDDAMLYVRNRDKTQLDSNNARMERQKQYLNAFFDKAMQATKEDLQVPLNLFNEVSADSVSNLDASKITFLATNLLQHHSTPVFHQAPGTVTEGEDGKAQYHVDEKALYELVLKVFYEPVD
ncbi:MAG: LCP family protein [Acutalibacteraceae bacterium]